jgi:hypothetical protein
VSSFSDDDDEVEVKVLQERRRKKNTVRKFWESIIVMLTVEKVK